MYTLVTNLYRSWKQREEYIIMILGLDNAGKTTLLERIKSIYLKVPSLQRSQITPTVGMNVGRIDLDKSRISFWDLGGQKDLHSLWETYYPEAHAVIFVVDSTDRDRIKDWSEAFQRLITRTTTEGVPILVLANKQDLPDAMRVEEVKEALNRFVADIGARETKVSPCVAVRDEGVDTAVTWLWKRILGNKASRPPRLK